MDLSVFLKREYPNIQFSIILGSDTFNDLRAGKWKNSEELLQTMGFEVNSTMLQIYDSLVENSGIILCRNRSFLVQELFNKHIPHVKEKASHFMTFQAYKMSPRLFCEMHLRHLSVTRIKLGSTFAMAFNES